MLIFNCEIGKRFIMLFIFVQNVCKHKRQALRDYKISQCNYKFIPAVVSTSVHWNQSQRVFIEMVKHHFNSEQTLVRKIADRTLQILRYLLMLLFLWTVALVPYLRKSLFSPSHFYAPSIYTVLRAHEKYGLGQHRQKSSGRKTQQY